VTLSIWLHKLFQLLRAEMRAQLRGIRRLESAKKRHKQQLTSGTLPPALKMGEEPLSAPGVRTEEAIWESGSAPAPDSEENDQVRLMRLMDL
jgi:hypothetical protein